MSKDVPDVKAVKDNPDTKAVKEDTKKVDATNYAARAQSYGLDKTWLDDAVKKYGQSVLELIVSALENGFSVQFVKDVLDKLGPFFLEVLSQVYGTKMKAVAAGKAEGTVALNMDDVVFKALIQKLLPVIVERYGPKVLQLLTDLLLKALQTG